MTATPHHPEGRSPLDELSDVLRPAVAQVRAAAPPADALQRALGRARRLGPPRPRRVRFRHDLLAAAGIAAMLLLGLGLVPSQRPDAPPRPAPPGEPEVALHSRLDDSARQRGDRDAKFRERRDRMREEDGNETETKGAVRSVQVESKREAGASPASPDPGPPLRRAPTANTPLVPAPVAPSGPIGSASALPSRPAPTGGFGMPGPAAGGMPGMPGMPAGRGGPGMAGGGRFGDPAPANRSFGGMMPGGAGGPGAGGFGGGGFQGGGQGTARGLNTPAGIGGGGSMPSVPPIAAPPPGLAVTPGTPPRAREGQNKDAPPAYYLQTAGRQAAGEQKEELSKLVRDWRKMPEQERAKALEQFERHLSEADKQALELSYRRTNRSAAPADAKPGEPGRGRGEADRSAKEVTRLAQDQAQLRAPAGGNGKGRKGEGGEAKAGAAKDMLEAEAQKVAADEIGKRLALRQEARKKALADLEVKQLNEALAKDKKSDGAKRGGADKKAEAAAPQVWKQDESRPRFARVYLGDNNSLELVSLQVSVTIEGPRARTVVDHVFRNPHPRQLEGTFEYPLPAGASPSYFAMFLGQTRDTAPDRFRRRAGGAPNVAFDALPQLTPAQLARNIDTNDWGRLQEARVVGKQKALEAYEEVVRGRIDPALMEYASGNTFSGRVFPIPPKGYNRVILAYEELLPVVEGRQLYRFPLPNRPLEGMQFTLQANTAECQEALFVPRDAKTQDGGGRVVYSRTWGIKEEPQGNVLFSCRPADPRVQAVSGRDGDSGQRYVYARLRPDLKTVASGASFASRAVFLLDTSLSEHPERFAVSMRLLRKILENDPAIKEFNVLAFNVGAAWAEPAGWLPNNAAGRQRAFNKLDGVVLEGATDLSCALDKLVSPGFPVPGGTPLDCFLLSDGHITWGESDVNALVARFERLCPYPTRFHCYRCGLGEENAELYDALTRKGGGTFQCFTPDAVDAASRAHRTQCLQVERVRFVGGPEASDVLVAGRRAAVYPGGELVVAARMSGRGRTTVLVEGKFAGRNVAEEFPLEVRDGGELAARGWGEVAVASLLALHDPKLDPLVTAYCQQFGIASRAASFLVLENENDYKRLNLEEERGRTVRGDLAEFIAKAWAELGKDASPRQLLERFLKGAGKRVNLLEGPNGPHVQRMLELLKDEDFELPNKPVRGEILHRRDVPPSYYIERERDRQNVTTYLSEAARRIDRDDVDGAVRALSSVIEVYPARGDALRLVGYRLLDMGQAAQAARLFQRVQQSRPFEPHSYRDLARSLEESGKYAAAALQYEIVLAGNWDARFRDSLKVVAREEYARMMQDAIRKKALRKELADHFGERLEKMTAPQPKSDLRVTISWNTDATDVDLWVIEPDGTKCFYQHQRTKNGGELSQDQTQGYGPERYQVKEAKPGVYTVIVHYYRPNPNLLGGETHVNVNVARNAGTAQETVERHTVTLKKHNQQVEVCKIKF